MKECRNGVAPVDHQEWCDGLDTMQAYGCASSCADSGTVHNHLCLCVEGSANIDGVVSHTL